MHEIRAEIAANVWQVVVEEGQMVAEGDEICILESMKMEIPVVTEIPGWCASCTWHPSRPCRRATSSRSSTRTRSP